jgi:hypothetical protein
VRPTSSDGTDDGVLKISSSVPVLIPRSSARGSESTAAARSRYATVPMTRKPK